MTCLCSIDDNMCSRRDMQVCRAGVSCAFNKWDIQIVHNNQMLCLDSRLLLQKSAMLSANQLQRVKTHVIESFTSYPGPVSWVIMYTRNSDHATQRVRVDCPLHYLAYMISHNTPSDSVFSTVSTNSLAQLVRDDMLPGFELNQLSPFVFSKHEELVALARDSQWLPFPEAKEFFTTLTINMQRVVLGYTRYWDQLLNTFLRQGDITQVKSFHKLFPRAKTATTAIRKAILDRVIILQDVLSQFRLPRPIHVYRGITVEQKQTQTIGNYTYNGIKSNVKETYKLGDVFTANSFLSTTTNIGIASEFAGKSCCLFRILLPAGTFALPLFSDVEENRIKETSHFEEREILLPWGCTFKVINILQHNGITSYDCVLIGQSDARPIPTNAVRDFDETIVSTSAAVAETARLPWMQDQLKRLNSLKTERKQEKARQDEPIMNRNRTTLKEHEQILQAWEEYMRSHIPWLTLQFDWAKQTMTLNA